MSSDYSYDDGQFYPFFIFTLSTVITLPLTYSLLRPSTDADALAPRIKTDYKPDHHEIIQAQRAALKRKQRKVKRFIAALVGWAIMGFMLYLIVTTQRTVTKTWNPYEILGIPESLNEKQIKSFYKKLSVKFHPDKARPDPAKNETIESLSDRWVDLTKAYQALTDEEVRNNWMMYGNPDGKQGFSISIALPSFIVAEGNGKYVVLVYALLLGVLLPYLVGSWWYGTQRMSKEGILIESANSLFREYSDDIDEGGIVAALSAGKEYEAQFKGNKSESGLSKIESKVAQEGLTGGLSGKEKEKLDDIDSGLRRKVLGLLWAYLGRVDLEDKTLNAAKFAVTPIAQSLNNSFNAIALAYGNTAPILASYFTGQRLIQAIPPQASPLYQLPHVTPAVVQSIDGESKVPTTVQQFMSQPDVERRRLAVGKGLLTEDQYQDVITVARQLPYFGVEKAFFKVTGERVIIPSSLVSLVVKGRFVPPGSQNVPVVKEADLEDPDPVEGELVKATDDSDRVLPPLTFAPYYARSHSPRWHVFLTDSKQGKMAVPPFTFATFDKPIFKADGTPTFEMQTLKAQFAAPPGPGHYTFVMHVICDSYVGFDAKMEVTLVVEDASRADAMAAEDEISEPDEGKNSTNYDPVAFNANKSSDSLAGQMNVLKGGSPPGTTKPKKRVDDSSEEEESGTEEEVDDTSETNTDTEDEGS
ncbi:translocation protein SEC63 [Apiospora sp. TS-2023a]